MKMRGMIVLLVSAWALGSLIMGCDTRNSTVSISPSSVLLSASTSASTAFTASGGDGLYTWTLSNNSLGVILTNNLPGPYATNDATAVYQNGVVAGVNILTVSDAGGDSASATITQE